MSDDNSDLIKRLHTVNVNYQVAQDAIKALTTAKAEIAALQHDLSRHLSITSEQATEILGKEKRIAELEAKLQSERGDDALATMRLLEESDAQSVLLKKAETALDKLQSGDIPTREEMRAFARAVLSELQLKKG